LDAKFWLLENPNKLPPKDEKVTEEQ